jgi:hypothetical protein
MNFTSTIMVHGCSLSWDRVLQFRQLQPGVHVPLCSFVFCRQRQDERLRRGGEQKSVVLLSMYPYSSVLSPLCQYAGPLFFNYGHEALAEVLPLSQAMRSVFVGALLAWSNRGQNLASPVMNDHHFFAIVPDTIAQLLCSSCLRFAQQICCGRFNTLGGAEGSRQQAAIVTVGGCFQDHCSGDTRIASACAADARGGARVGGAGDGRPGNPVDRGAVHHDAPAAGRSAAAAGAPRGLRPHRPGASRACGVQPETMASAICICVFCVI